MRTRASWFIPLALLLAVPSLVEAQGRLRGAIRLAGDFGGDQVLEFEYEDGSTPEVTAGGGLLFTIGGIFDAFTSTSGHGLDLQANAGLKYRTIPPATNQEATWLRFPVEGLAFYRAPKHVRLGIGTTMHLGNALKVSGDVASGEIRFVPKPGFLLQAEYRRNNVGFDLRYTGLKYEVDGTEGDVDASSFGGGVSFYFGR